MNKRDDLTSIAACWTPAKSTFISSLFLMFFPFKYMIHIKRSIVKWEGELWGCPASDDGPCSLGAIGHLGDAPSGPQMALSVGLLMALPSGLLQVALPSSRSGPSHWAASGFAHWEGPERSYNTTKLKYQLNYEAINSGEKLTMKFLPMGSITIMRKERSY